MPKIKYFILKLFAAILIFLTALVLFGTNHAFAAQKVHHKSVRKAKRKAVKKSNNGFQCIKLVLHSRAAFLD